ncbi:MAG: alkaline phosphatase family protein, partial [Deltaproteobacteria bacterium]|nr:alkaline phosphatase family protein [Deltaproteobacteria bacterium]
MARMVRFALRCRIPLWLARISHQVATATAHLRTLTRDFGLRLLDVPRGTPPGPNPEISRQSTNLHRLATRPGEKCGLAIVAALLAGAAASAGAPTVILLSLDGTPARAARTPALETLSELARRGAAAERLTPVFPTNTFPNHVTLVTGVSPERHGIVNNVFLDPKRGLFRKSDDPTWIEAEPLWSIAARYGIVSASYYWVGSEGPWRSGHGPRYWKRFDASTPDREKVEQILAWLDLEPEQERPCLITAWFPGADSAGHRFGPDAPEVWRALERQDAAIGRLVSGLDARRAFEHTTLLVVSDHGMLEVERRVDLDAALDAADLPATVWGGGGFAS